MCECATLTEASTQKPTEEEHFFGTLNFLGSHMINVWMCDILKCNIWVKPIWHTHECIIWMAHMIWSWHMHGESKERRETLLAAFAAGASEAKEQNDKYEGYGNDYQHLHRKNTRTQTHPNTRTYMHTHSLTHIHTYAHRHRHTHTHAHVKLAKTQSVSQQRQTNTSITCICTYNATTHTHTHTHTHSYANTTYPYTHTHSHTLTMRVPRPASVCVDMLLVLFAVVDSICLFLLFFFALTSVFSCQCVCATVYNDENLLTFIRR